MISAEGENIACIVKALTIGARTVLTLGKIKKKKHTHGWFLLVSSDAFSANCGKTFGHQGLCDIFS